MRAAAIALFVLALAPQLAQATAVAKTEVSEKDGHYKVDFEVVIDAPIQKVRQIMTDYARLSRLSDTITESRVLAAETNKQRVGLTFRACVLFFCRTMKRVEDVETLADGDIVATAVPQLSDFHYSVEHWRIAGEHARTRIKYHAELSPSFYVPPLLGPWLMKSKIRNELETTAKKIEALTHS